MAENDTIYLQSLMLSVGQEFEERLIGWFWLGDISCDFRQMLAGAVRAGMRDAKAVGGWLGTSFHGFSEPVHVVFPYRLVWASYIMVASALSDINRAPESDKS